MTIQDMLRAVQHYASMFAAGTSGNIAKGTAIVKAFTDTAITLLDQGKSSDEVIASIHRILPHRQTEIDLEVEGWVDTLRRKERENE